MLVTIKSNPLSFKDDLQIQSPQGTFLDLQSMEGKIHNRTEVPTHEQIAAQSGSQLSRVSFFFFPGIK